MSTTTNQITWVFGAVNNISKTTQQISKDTTRLSTQFTKLSGAIQNAFQFYVRYRIFGLINQGINALQNAIPGLISRGQEWAKTVDAIADATGLAAGRSSTLAYIATTMIGSVDGLERALGALANTTSNHADTLKRYGIETRAANGQMLDSWTVLRNVRRAMSDLGNGFLTTAAARELFSRGGQALIDMLTLTDKQFRMLEQDARQSGVVMTDVALRQAEVWQRTQQRAEMSVTGIANLVTTSVQPMLTRLVDGITNYIRQNMSQIVGFVTRVIGFVMGMVSGLLGIDMNMESFFESFETAGKSKEKIEAQLGRGAKSRAAQTRTEDGYTSAIERQIEAIDRQLGAMSRADRARDAREEQRRLLQEISEARQELSDLRSKSIFAAGMSEREAELARQQQAADIVEAEKKITDAQRRLGEQNRKAVMEQRRFELEQRKASLQEQANEHMKALAQKNSPEAMGQIFDPVITAMKDLPPNVREAWKAGLAGAEQGFGEGSPFGIQMRGWIENLKTWWSADVQPFLQTLATEFGKVVDLATAIREWFPTLIGAIVAWKIAAFASGVAGAGASVLTGAAGAAAGIGAGALGALAVPAAGAAVAAAVAIRNSQIFDEIKAGNFANLSEFLKVASGDQLQAAATTLRNLPASLDGVQGAIYGLSSGIWGLDFVLGGVKGHNEGILQQLETEMANRAKTDQASAKSMADLATQTTSGGTSVAGWSQTMAGYMQRIAYPRPGQVWGTANVSVYMPDGTFIVGAGNIPIATGNSSIRIRRDQ